MARITRTMQSHKPSGETFVLEYEDITIIAVSDALHMDDRDADLWDYNLHDDSEGWGEQQEWHFPTRDSDDPGEQPK